MRRRDGLYFAMLVPFTILACFMVGRAVIESTLAQNRAQPPPQNMLPSRAASRVAASEAAIEAEEATVERAVTLRDSFILNDWQIKVTSWKLADCVENDDGLVIAEAEEGELFLLLGLTVTALAFADQTFFSLAVPGEEREDVVLLSGDRQVGVARPDIQGAGLLSCNAFTARGTRYGRIVCTVPAEIALDEDVPLTAVFTFGEKRRVLALRQGAAADDGDREEATATQ